MEGISGKQFSNDSENDKALEDPKCNDKIIAKQTCDSIDPIVLNKPDEDNDLSEIVSSALTKMKEVFFQNNIDEQRLAEFLFKILSLSAKDSKHMESNHFKITTKLLDNIIEQMMEQNSTNDHNYSLNDVIDSIFGADTSEALNATMPAEKIDEIVVKLLGEDTKKMICEKLGNDCLDELLNNLIDEKQILSENPDAEHPHFDDFIGKILGKDTEEFIIKKLEAFLNDAKRNKGSKLVEINDLD